MSFFTRMECNVMRSKYIFNFDFKCFVIWNKLAEFINSQVRFNKAEKAFDVKDG